MKKRICVCIEPRELPKIDRDRKTVGLSRSAYLAKLARDVPNPVKPPVAKRAPRPSTVQKTPPAKTEE